MKERIWIGPTNGEGFEESVDEMDRRILVERRFGEFRVVCAGGDEKDETFSIFLEDWPREYSPLDLAHAAASLVGRGCDSVQVFRPDGSQVLP